MGEIKNNKSILLFLLFFSFSSFAQEKLSLKDCIDRAIEKNISIKNSSLDLLNSTENKKTAIGNFVPSFNINGNHSWNTGLTQNITTGILENQVETLIEEYQDSFQKVKVFRKDNWALVEMCF